MIKRDKKLEKKIASERIEYLLERAHIVKLRDFNLAKRYVELAMKISIRYRVKIPEKYRNTFCRKCFSPFSSDCVSIRLNRGVKIIRCLNCGFTKRMPYKRREN
jgi:ribonuclease P protein subunit RPR2